jgi:selenocysteine-specific translation elongation factor
LHIKGDLRLDYGNGILVKSSGDVLTSVNPSDLRIKANLNNSVITSSAIANGSVSNLILQSNSAVSTPNGAGNVGVKNDYPTSALDVTSQALE